MVVAEDCAYCHDLADAFAAEMKQLGSSVSIRVAISESQQDFKNIVHELKAMNLDAILLPNYELSSARVISTLSEAGLHPAFLGGDGWGNVGEEFFKIINGRKFTAYSVSHWHSDLKTAASIRFKKRYIEKFSKEPNDTAVLAYDAMSLLLNAILSTDRYARADVESALSRLQSFSGVTGVFKYRSQGGAPEKSIVLLRAENSKFKLIEQINPVGSDR
jgi:branched-chain amino acid transport system substrate-binding protein